MAYSKHVTIGLSLLLCLMTLPVVQGSDPDCTVTNDSWRIADGEDDWCLRTIAPVFQEEQGPDIVQDLPTALGAVFEVTDESDEADSNGIWDQNGGGNDGRLLTIWVELQSGSCGVAGAFCGFSIVACADLDDDGICSKTDSRTDDDDDDGNPD